MTNDLIGLPLGGRLALVTGAGRARGIGREIALELARQGADVVVHGSPRAPDSYLPHEREAGWRGPASVAAEIVALGQRAHAVEVDLSDDNGPGELAAEARAAIGTIDVLVNNAAMAGTTGTQTLAELDDAVWTQTVAVNMTAVFRLCKELIPGMLEAGQGSIVNISSLAGTKPRPRFGAYSATKAAVIALTRQLALEFAPAVRVNSVSPGSTETDMLDGTFSRHDQLSGSPSGTFRKQNIARIPMLRQGQPEDIARVVAFLASDAAGFVTGQNVSVDGGQDLR
jgi:NAD(P)-dependent dehydrogenase (short-subunit alcohol dehydrogenase family)